jgi:hypothetical protein
MPLDEQIKEAAEKIWDKIKTHLRIANPTAPAFSPRSLWTINNLFESDDERKPGGLLFFWESAQSPVGVIQRQQRIFELGAYVGEVVRRHYGDKCAWGDEVREREIELHLPGGKKPLHPMRFIGEQITKYKSGSIVKWGVDAGLPVGERPKRPAAHFKPS